MLGALRHTVRVSSSRISLQPNGAPSPQEAAAVVAALERFMRATAPAPAPVAEPADRWRRAAILEGVERGGTQGDAPDPWINT